MMASTDERRNVELNEIKRDNGDVLNVLWKIFRNRRHFWLLLWFVSGIVTATTAPSLLKNGFTLKKILITN